MATRSPHHRALLTRRFTDHLTFGQWLHAEDHPAGEGKGVVLALCLALILWGTVALVWVLQRRLTTLGMTPSMSRKGNCYDNAVAESFFSTLKSELVHHQTYHTRDEASRELFAFIEGFYNRQRLHQSLRHRSPLEFERRISDS